MKTDIKNIAAFVAAAIWADEVYDEAEKVAVEEIAEALELEGFAAAVEAEIAKVGGMDGQAVSDYLVEAGQGVDDEELAHVFEAVMQILLSDGILSYAEANNLLVAADALGLEHEYALLMIADMIKEEPEMEVSFE